MPKHKTVVTFSEQRVAKAFLQYLNKHYSKAIKADDSLLIMAVIAWFHQESGSLSRVIGNNPFNIRDSPLASGQRRSRGNGHFATFSTLSKGFEAAAYLLIHGGRGYKTQSQVYVGADGRKHTRTVVVGEGNKDAYGYRLALNALKLSGNEGAWNFLTALAMSSWDAAHYGSHNWQQAGKASHNHLLRNYLGMGGLATVVQKTKKVRKKVEIPPPPADLGAPVGATPGQYLDPWAVLGFYRARHPSVTLPDDQ